ncbi:hypothetical protein GGX14DRAFT_553492 [Mycena pura]|uniref:Uncharacterized protein n=1 Tax=Mycena pura TaxID=153505 RepID=A0AAD6YV92_9AGAR|nr:hypothetical protein GGX14DRAFT_553492 [Mycena pura]
MPQIFTQKSSSGKENTRGRGRGSKQQPQPPRSPRPALQSHNNNTPAANTSPSDIEALQKRIEELERFWTYCRDALTSARLNTGENWKAQHAEKLTMAYNTIEEAFPETRRFQGQWGIDRTVKQCWDNRTNYRNNVDKPDTYRGREAAARRARRNGSSPPRLSHSPPPSDRDRAASPGPSRPAPRPKKNPARFMAQSPDEYDDDENEERARVGTSATALGKRKADGEGGRERRVRRRVE